MCLQCSLKTMMSRIAGCSGRKRELNFCKITNLGKLDLSIYWREIAKSLREGIITEGTVIAINTVYKSKKRICYSNSPFLRGVSAVFQSAPISRFSSHSWASDSMDRECLCTEQALRRPRNGIAAWKGLDKTTGSINSRLCIKTHPNRGYAIDPWYTVNGINSKQNSH